MRSIAVLCVLAACAGPGKKPAPLSDEGTAARQTPPELPTPEELYAQCEDRVEGTRVDGECTRDEDCATAGCAGEVCTTAAGAADVTTTCENKLCFSILETCGCIDGQCSWAIADAIPEEALPRIPRPPGLGSSLPTQEDREE